MNVNYISQKRYATKIPSKFAPRIRSDLEQQNWLEVIKFLHDSLVNNVMVDETFVCNLNKMILRGFQNLESESGKYRNRSVVLLKGGRVIYRPVPAENVIRLMADLFKLINTLCSDLIEKIGLVYMKFIEIHPFVEGNGRVVRALSIYLLLRGGFQQQTNSTLESFFDQYIFEYYSTLNQGYMQGNPGPWLSFFRKAVQDTMVSPQIEPKI